MEINDVLLFLEHLESQLQVIAEGVSALHEKLTIHMKENRSDFLFMQENFDSNNHQHQTMMSMIAQLCEDQAELRRA